MTYVMQLLVVTGNLKENHDQWLDIHAERINCSLETLLEMKMNSIRTRRLVLMVLTITALLIIFLRMDKKRVKRIPVALNLNGPPMDVSPTEHVNVPQTNKSTFGDQKCRIPTLDPFDKEIVNYFKSTIWQRCELVQYGRVDNNNMLKLTARNVVAAYIRYIERVNDFDIALSPSITIFGQGVPINYPAGGVKGKKCWDECGEKTGHCPHVCGAGGFCCRAGFTGCPPNISADLIPKEFHA